MNPPLKRMFQSLVFLILPLMTSQAAPPKTTPGETLQTWSRHLKMPPHLWQIAEFQSLENPTATLTKHQEIPQTSIYTTFIPTKKTVRPSEIIQKIQIELSRTSPPPTGTSKALSKNQHWMEYNLPRRNTYGAIHLIKTPKGLLAVHMEKNPETPNSTWEKQKDMIKKLVLSKNGELFCLGLRLETPLIK